MAITDTQTTADASAGESAGAPSDGRLASLLGASDHKTVGRLWITAGVVLGAAALVVAALWQFNLLGEFLPTDSVFRVFVLGELALPLLLVAPILVGLATVVVPLQVGSATLAFPRAAALGFWAWLLGTVLFLVSFAIEGGPTGPSREAVGLTYLGLLVLVAGLLLAVVCVAATVLAMRAPGMTLDRVPLFSWSMLVTAGVWFLTLPVWMGNLMLIFTDSYYGAPTEWGVGFNQWPQISWLVSQPQVFAFVIPVLGIIGDIGVTFARTRMPLRGVVLTAIGAFGALSMGAYVQPYFVSGVWTSWLFVGQSALLLLPVLVVLGSVVGVLRSGRPKLSAPLMAAVVALLALVLATLAAVPFGIERLGLTETADGVLADQAVREAAAGVPVYQWGLLFLVAGTAVAGAIAGLFYWAPKLVGRRALDGAGRLLALGALLGAALAGLPLVILGLARQVEAIADAADALYGASATGLAVLALVLVAAALGVLTRRTTGDGADPDDAWGLGQSLEWACPNPPPAGNFAEIPTVESPEPLLDGAEEEG